MSLSDRIKADIAKANERFPSVIELAYDGECLLTFTVDGQDFTAVLSDVYGQECEISGPDDLELSCRGSIVDIVATVMAHLSGEDLPDDVEMSPGPSSATSPSALLRGSSEEGLDDMFFTSDGKCIIPQVQAEIAILQKEHGVQCTMDVVSQSVVRVALGLPLKDLISRSTGDAWGLARDKPLFISFEVNDSHYSRHSSQRLEARAWQEQTKDGYLPLDASVQLVNMISSFWWSLCGGQSVVSCVDCPGSSTVKEHLVKKKAAFVGAGRSQEGVLLPLALYVMKRLPCLHEYCVICDEPLVFPPLLRPTVCTRTLCSFSARTFGTAITGEFSGQNASLELWDLLCAMAICAGAMPVDRMQILFAKEHFPKLFLPGSQLPAFSDDKDGMEKLRKLLHTLKDYRKKEVGKHGVCWLNQALSGEGGCDPLLGSLLGWIWDSNRSYILALESNDRIASLCTSYQYLLLSAPPEMEAAFQGLKTKHGSEFCFHGSGTANWHCILRQGLKNASNTKLMTAGAAHGPGIYLARNSMTSAGYSGAAGYSRSQPPQAPELKREVTGQRAHDPERLVMLAICEVANVPQLKKHSNIWVCPEEAAVVTRFFLVYSESNVPNIELNDKGITTELRQLTNRWTG